MRPSAPAVASALFAFGCALSSCGPRARTIVRGGSDPSLAPPQPPPPGTKTVYGPLRIEAVDAVRHEIGWERDLVRATRLVTYDVTLAQERATCADALLVEPFARDAEGCAGLAKIPAKCSVEAPLRARIEVSVTHAIEITQRCGAGGAPFAVPETGDPKPELTRQGIACFRLRNGSKPEATWTSLYELTELRFVETPIDASSLAPIAIMDLLEAEGGHGAGRFCRDDGAYLDGTVGAPSAPRVPREVPRPTVATLAPALSLRTPLGTSKAAAIPLTARGGGADADFRSEHALWEECNDPGARTHVVAQERCLLLRHLDRFLREVDDAARPQTPKGSMPAGTP
jgi:hypothetical protein